MSENWTRSDNEIIATLQDVVAIESINPSLPGGQIGEAGMVEYIERFFGNLDIPCRRQEVLPGRCNLIATLPGEQPEQVLLFECHMDTASADIMTIPPFSPHIRSGMLFGRGACDTKAGGVAMLHAMKRLRQTGVRPPQTIIFAGCVDEEHLFRGSRHLASHLRTNAAVIAEPTQLQIVNAHKGAVRFHLNVRGRAAHSSKPELGHSAIVDMARLILRFEDELNPAFKARHFPLIGSPTFNVGTIDGGTQVNFVPDQCRATVDCRTLPGEDTAFTVDIFQAVINREKREHPGLDAEIETPYFVCAPLQTDRNAAIVRNAVSACTKIANDATIVAVPYATDGSPFCERGVPTIVLGPGNIDQAHGAEEWVDCQQVMDAVDIYYSLMISELES